MFHITLLNLTHQDHIFYPFDVFNPVSANPPPYDPSLSEMSSPGTSASSIIHRTLSWGCAGSYISSVNCLPERITRLTNITVCGERCRKKETSSTLHRLQIRRGSSKRVPFYSS
ncbi:hypothetical protein RRG08_056863 [Elysia crispata]|uniref:Uncharacterized protein n=1 Tax=Elysia crispata TaxID=231223 RepID=A0AAE0Z3J7_9GAST|nr:hypothetical protein RRG08_056863 [Elysia crispata]